MKNHSLFSHEVTLDKMKNILESVRVSAVTEEIELQNIIAQILSDNSIPFAKEYRLGPRNRIDFFIPDIGIGIEVKKGKPHYRQVYQQLCRYCNFDNLTGIILVVERNLTGIPAEINNKPCVVIGLNRLWGIAI
ncbi:hypothetical protein [Pectinatus frisingensis]|uniref:hypothetical protein n=1 Tax=Pectinatus frisingensis TaxID=865 RepID=UPI0018C73CDB|nr:hypothetical protein [Pectinatus frisingensis]